VSNQIVCHLKLEDNPLAGRRTLCGLSQAEFWVGVVVDSRTGRQWIADNSNLYRLCKSCGNKPIVLLLELKHSKL
jgi:hypothetical protein